ncbi:PIN domain-containing protein [Wenzhouxiangella sp. XN79A]|uniref:PIN domain-containing protein n=1 Tax=Wenzhouxiangella sp. XN79A TaxID=2724193 RepID=UPI00144A7FE5|nr:PIN domain-containing protein [Wenzhouxiangella sp. XN79A]NKI36446.1 PIN domain-containing protein [Wenzhouxiangella sp. XN79A]
MTDRYFVDTNILVYSRDTRDPTKHRIARRWLAELWSSGNGRISTQVLKEYYQTVTRRLKPGMARDDARADVRDLQTWKPLELTAATFEQAWSIEDRMKISWWDALIVAAARQTGCTFLISEDLQSGQIIENLTIIDPFSTTLNEP